VTQLTQAVEGRLKVAEALANGEYGGGYVEACLIISGVFSGLAADVWPGRSIDQMRFVELWVQHTDATLRPNLIALPLLIYALGRDGKTAEAEQLVKATPGKFGGGYASLVLTGDDVDMPVANVQQIVPTVDLKYLRKYTYGSVFYRHVRSAATHEYELGTRATGMPMTERDVGISYSNRLDADTMQSRRLIHYHIPWLLDLVRSAATAVESLPLPQQRPGKWWVEG